VSQDEIRIELEVSGTPPFAVSVGGDEPLILEKEGRASILHRLPAEDGPHSFPIEVSGQGEPWTGDISLVLDRRPPILDSLDPSPGTYWFPGQGLQVTASADEDLGSGTRIGGVDPDLVGATATAVCSFSSDGKIEIVLADRAGNVAEQRTLELRPVRVPAGMQPDPASGVDEQLGWARAISEPRTGITLVLVPTPPREGFWMGAVPGDDLALDREKPGHRVTLSRPFYLGKTEVSWRQWSTAIAAGKLDRFEAVPDISAISDWSNVTEDLPVLDVSWQQAVAFCSWLGMTLPTEAQWEWACRQEAELTAYPWGSSFDDGQGWANVADASSDFGTRDDRPATFKDGFEHTAPVGSLQPSTAAGFRHLIGNVMEWCRDAEDFDAYRSRVGRLTADPLVTLPGSRRRILKGGSYKHGARSCRISSRSSLAEDDRANFRTIGFRVCLEIDGD
jgi:formylglycine-generating enzyme required for sulfatase activity